MLFLISISSLSFLILVTMVSLRLFGYSFCNKSVCSELLKKSNKYLGDFFSLAKGKIRLYKKELSISAYIGKFLLFQIIRLYDIISFLLRKVKNKFNKYLKKVSLKEKGETVSEYLRTISDYKKGSNDTKI